MKHLSSVVPPVCAAVLVMFLGPYACWRWLHVDGLICYGLFVLELAGVLFGLANADGAEP